MTHEIPPERTDLPLRVAKAMIAKEGAAAQWGLELLEAGPGRSAVGMTVTSEMLNGFGTMHGGMIFALAEAAFAYAANSRNVASVGQQASISFLAPAGLGDRLIASAREEAVVGRCGSYTVTIVCAHRVIAIFHGLSRSLGHPTIVLPSGDSE